MNKADKGDVNSNTQRMQTVAGLQPAFSPGEFVFLNCAIPGFPDGTRFKVIAARSIGSNQHRYELQGNGQTIWVLEADLRSTAPDSLAGDPAQAVPGRALSMTQRMQTMTLSQRMTALGLNNDGDVDNNTTQRLRVLDNTDGAFTPAPSGPVTGAPAIDGAPTGANPPAPKKPDEK
jgi:hypothetical protein